MGVVYKLTPDISAFIIEHKRNQPSMTCQALADIVLSEFGQQVSKSSVHELLKQSHVITPRTRKIKEKFQIPLHKKEQISKELAPFVSIGLTPVASKPIEAPVPEKIVEEIKEAIPEAQEEIVPVSLKELSKGVGEIFLKAALYDLSFKSALGISDYAQLENINNIKLRSEWEYLTKLVYAIKIELEDKKEFYLDPRFQGLYEQNPNDASLAAPIERVAYEVADYILNNIKPMIIRNVSINTSNQCLYDYLAAMQNIAGRKIVKISLRGDKDEVLAEFNRPVTYQRRFIIGAFAKANEFQWFTNNSEVEALWDLPSNDNEEKKNKVKLLKKSNKIVITNLDSYGYEESFRMYDNRHPLEGLNVTPILQYSPEDMLNQAQWIKNRLKKRALMFFSSLFSLQELEDVLIIEGYEEIVVDKSKKTEGLKITLRVENNFQHSAQLKRAIVNVNSLDILDFKGRKIILFMEPITD